MGKIYVKQAGEDISSLKPIVTVGITVPSDIAANDIVITDGKGSIQTSGININSIDAKTLNGLESTAFASSADIEKIVDGTTTIAKASHSVSADKIETDAGSVTQPVYFKNGIPVETTYTLGKSVPSDAEFTDTVYEHPDTHPASIIIEDETHRFVTDEEKTAWNSSLSDAKAYTNTKIGELIDSAPETMDTLKEVAEAIAAHQDITDALNSAIGNKADGTNGVANNASKLNGQAASYYAKAADLTTTNTNVSNIVDGTTTVAKATSAGTCTGNAATATKATQLANSRTINGVSFNGTANITVPIVTSGTTAPSNTTLLWLDTNYTPNLLKFYNGSSWQALNTYQ